MIFFLHNLYTNIFLDQVILSKYCNLRLMVRGKNRTIKKKNQTIKKKRVYTRKHYNSNDGMMTSIWGPGAWHFIHTVSFNYPIHPSCDEKREYRDFILGLENILPCGKCRTNFQHNLKKLPLTWNKMKNRHTFSKYVYKLHELINKMLGKSSGLSYPDIRERYEHFRARCNASPIDKSTTIEDGCTEPLVGEKSKCILQIIPQTIKCDTFQIDETCKKRKTS
jgi:hypothetical protein